MENKRLSITKLPHPGIKLSLLASLLLPTMWGCNEPTEIERMGAARIVPMLSVDVSAVAPDDNTVEITDRQPDSNSFSLSLESMDGAYAHTWSSFGEYPQSELLRVGTYTVKVAHGSQTDEGYGKPYFEGHRQVTLSSGDETNVDITAQLASTVIDLTIDPSLGQRFKNVSATLNSSGFTYVTCLPGESGHIFMHPGNIGITLSVTDGSGTESNIAIGTLPDALPRHIYNVELTSDGQDAPTVTARANGVELGQLTLTPELLSAPVPEITPCGFTPGTIVTGPEGNIPPTETSFKVAGNVSSLTLTTISAFLVSQGWPRSIDLATISADEERRLANNGVAIARNTDGSISSVNIAGLLSKLRTGKGFGTNSFTLLAKGANGKQSNPVTLLYAPTPVDISVVSVSNVMIGTEKARMQLICRSGDLERNLSIEAMTDSRQWQPCPIESIAQSGQGDYEVNFTVPQGTAAELKVRVLYCDAPVHTVGLKRVSPTYTVKTDAFALSASMIVEADDPSLTPLITSLLRIYVNGTMMATSNRINESGQIIFGPLSPNTAYSVQTSIIDNPTAAELSPAIKFRTEKTLQIENNSFEDHEDGIKHKALPCGGRYSQSIADIFNCQNHVDIDIQKPKVWANTNAKTFCAASTNKNTWYMIPSVMSEVDNVEGYFAVKLQSVAWDPSGAPIADYRQSPGSFIAYNPNVPEIKYRAAGKVFLGKYIFDPATLTETYVEGVPFESRPIALNGNYHFTPCVNDLYDTGKVTIEVLGESNGSEIVIAEGTALLEPALTYTAFSVPLTYTNFGIKATRLKVMLASSRHTGSIAFESANITTSPNPLTATSVGGELWLQDITLSYM